jgi:hypothetical protein
VTWFVRESGVTQREFDVLRARIDQMDQHGTRGVGTLQVRIDEIIKDLAELKVGYAEWQTGHLIMHKAESDDARTSRRYILTTSIAILAIVVTVLGLSVGHLIWH